MITPTKRPRLTVITHTGRTTSLCTKLQEQVDEFSMYKMADNFAGWLVKRFIKDGLSLANAEAKALNLLRDGSETVIDVRI